MSDWTNFKSLRKLNRIIMAKKWDDLTKKEKDTAKSVGRAIGIMLIFMLLKEWYLNTSFKSKLKTIFLWGLFFMSMAIVQNSNNNDVNPLTKLFAHLIGGFLIFYGIWRIIKWFRK